MVWYLIIKKINKNFKKKFMILLMNKVQVSQKELIQQITGFILMEKLKYVQHIFILSFCGEFFENVIRLGEIILEDVGGHLRVELGVAVQSV